MMTLLSGVIQPIREAPMVTVKELIEHLQDLPADAAVLVNTLPDRRAWPGAAGLRVVDAGLSGPDPGAGIYVLDLLV